MFLAAYVGTDPAGLVSKACTEKKKCSLSAGSVSVLADTFKLGHDIIYNYQQSPDGGWARNWRQLCCLPQNCSKCCPGRGWEVVGFAGQGQGAVCLVRGDSVCAKMILLLLPKWGCQSGLVWLLRDTSCYQMSSGFTLGFRFLHRDESSALVLLFMSEAVRRFPDCHFLIKSHLKSFLKDLHFLLIILRA